MLWLLRRNGYESAIRSGATSGRLRCSRRASKPLVLFGALPKRSAQPVRSAYDIPQEPTALTAEPTR
jgi:hypothetical protein